MPNPRTHRRHARLLARLAMTAVAATSVGMPVFAGGASLVTVIDFEEFAESTPLSDQYSSLGVWFSIEGDDSLFPIIAVEGSPAVAFTGSGADNPMASGSHGLTDPVIGGNNQVPNDIRMTFDPPATSVSFYLADIESGETVEVTAYDGSRVVGSQTVIGGSPGTGNGKNTLVSVSAGTITSVLVDISGGTSGAGWALDFVTVTRPCDEPGCAPRLRVSQESSPGAGDFARNILGEVNIFSASTTTAANIYAYNVPEASSWNGFIMSPTAERSHLLVVLTIEGYTIFWVHDRADNSDGGDAETRIELLGDPDGGEITVKDDPDASKDGFYVGAPGDSTFEARHAWSSCCSDGYGVSGLECGGSAIVQFTDVDGTPGTPTTDGFSEWVVYGAGDETIPLALEADRRVLLEHLPPENCPADLNCDGVVDAADLAILLGAWAGTGAADLDASGAVEAADLAILLGEWGPC